MPDPDTVLDRSLTVAREHVAWAKTEGQILAEVLCALGEPVPAHVSWDYVVGRVAEAWRCLSR